MAEPDDPFDLARFLTAQEDVYETALGEIRAGRKRSHWMWFIFPQLLGLGRTSTARQYAIRSLEEAAAYLAHPVLGPRLRACALAAATVPRGSAYQVFGNPDDLKLRSCATLFAKVEPPGSVFHRVLDRYYGGEADPMTIELLLRARQP